MNREEKPTLINGLELCIDKRWFKIARLRGEWYDFLSEPDILIGELVRRSAADIFTFVQTLIDTGPRFSYPHDFAFAAILAITTYDDWWNRQIRDKTRNMVRRAAKKGVRLKATAFDADLIDQIKSIYDETPIRQGKSFKHYNKSVEMLMKDHATYLDRSEFIGAYVGTELVGFVKLVFQNGWASMMQIISKISHRDKSPTNALIAKAVEVCASRDIPMLQYGSWSSGTIGDFKRHHGFSPLAVPRYYVPLNRIGAVVIACGLHRNVADRIPEFWRPYLTRWRSRWYELKHKHMGAVAQSVERCRVRR
jgi:hypothetical protein